MWGPWRDASYKSQFKSWHKIWRTIRIMSAGAALLCSFPASHALAQSAKATSSKHHGSHFSGIASFYDKDYVGKTASGARYDGRKFTAAHRSLPFGTRLRVTDKKSHRSVTVIVNDRGPFIKGRVIDLSYAAARALHMEQRGLLQVTASIE
jgi:rare lipoprotein A